MGVNLWLVITVVLCARQGYGASDTFNPSLYDPESLQMSQYITLAHKMENDPAFKADWGKKTEEISAQDFVFGPPTFECDVAASKSKKKATTIHELGPSDIKVMAAMGDSVTQGIGVGAENILEVFIGNRGESWSIGGEFTLDHGIITLANVMKKFSPELMGHSTCSSGRLSKHAWLNVAMGGATSVHMPGQAQDIINICREDGNIDMENDWKVVTLFVGGNDLCQDCQSNNLNSTLYASRIEEALDIMHAGLPRTFVNLVPMFDITPLKNFSEGVICEFLQPSVCPCGILDEHRPNARATQLDYYEKLDQLISTGKYDSTDDFTVVLQSMFVDLIPPIDPDTGFYDKTFLSHDCFHPSLKAHQAFAYALWNTMFIPIDEKPRDWDPYEENPTFTCPTQENPYFATVHNNH